MCVILEFDGSNKKEHITGEYLSDAEKGNKDGGGIAWIDGDVVRWEKGIHVTADYIKTLIKKENIKEPFVVHFRIATHGGVNDELCHPFALSPESDDLATSGSDKEGVMFHNGVWHNYKDFAMKTLLNRSDVKFLNGGISDSRVMAWLVRFYGKGYLSMIDEKVSVLTPKGLYQYGSGWTDVKGLKCSNDHFDHSNWGGYCNGWKNGTTKTYNNSQNDVSGQMTLVDDDDSKDFREARLSELREQNLETENERRTKNGESELSMEEYELLYDDEQMDSNTMDEEEEFEESMGYGFTDGAGIFHPYSSGGISI